MLYLILIHVSHLFNCTFFENIFNSKYLLTDLFLRNGMSKFVEISAH